MNPSMGVKGVPQAHMHPHIAGHPRHPQPISNNDMRVMLENNRIHHEQRRFQQQQQQQQGGQLQFPGQAGHGQTGPSSSPIMNNVNGLGRSVPLQSNPAMLAALRAASSIHGMTGSAASNPNVTAGSSASPRMSQTPFPR